MDGRGPDGGRHAGQARPSAGAAGSAGRGVCGIEAGRPALDGTRRRRRGDPRSGRCTSDAASEARQMSTSRRFRRVAATDNLRPARRQCWAAGTHAVVRPPMVRCSMRPRAGGRADRARDRSRRGLPAQDQPHWGALSRERQRVVERQVRATMNGSGGLRRRTNTRVSRLVVVGLVCSASLIVPARWTILAAGNEGMTVLGRVTAVPATGLVRREASFFDLEGKTVTFTPAGAGGYSVHVGALTWVEIDPATRRSFDFGELGEEPPSPFDDRFRPRIRRNSGGEDVRIALPFAFPFAGRTWTHFHANTNGNVSFAAPETTHWQQRDPWADGTMRSVAAAVDSRSAAGVEAMIAALWAVYGNATISVDYAPERVAITWDAVARNYEPAGPNVFQVRLYPSGAIEFAYRQVSERDGIVGLFHGTAARGQTLGAVEDAVGDVANATVDIASVELVDNGSTVVASVTMAADIPARVSSGSVEYRVFLDFDGKSCAVGLQVNTTGRRELSWCGAAPSVVGYRVQGATLEIPISKTLLNDARTVSWFMDAVWWGRDVFDHLDGSQSVSLDEWGHDLSSMAQTVTGNIFEVFHYPSMSKQMREITSFIYEQVPADDEIAVLFTDFRIDDLFNTGGGSGPINTPVQGIGGWQADPNPGSEYGSDSLLVTMSPVFVGGPNFRESGFGGDQGDRNHALAVFFVAHEAIHRWAVHLRFRNPRSGRIESLTDDGCRCHWSNWLHAPVAHPVWRDFADQPYPEASIMGGALWLDHGDGTFTWQGSGSWKAAGLSALDLYVMGMIPPEEVGPTFLLRDVVETSTRGRYRATKVPVRIEDIVAAMGPRVPDASEQRRVFRLGVYLLHEGDRAPRADLLARSRSITDAVARYFPAATGATDANRAPAAVATLPDRTLTLQGMLDVDVSQAFVDPDGDALTYAAASSAPHVVMARASGGRVTLTAAAAGMAAIQVTATDPGGLSATQSFAVTVKASAQFTDDPIRPGVTPVKAIHFTELRTRIDAVRREAGLGPFPWADRVLTAGVTPVRLVHLLELREALGAAYAAAGRSAPRWSDASPVAGSTPIRAAHVTELRAAVLVLE